MKIAVFLIAGLLWGAAVCAADWPPKAGQAYPDLELVDQTGAKVRLSSFKGSVIVIEPVGMTCPACQAFSGAGKRGGYGGVAAQKGLESIEDYFPRYAGGVRLNDPRIIFVQILFYGMDMKAPSHADAKKWARHFGFERAKNQIVLAGTPQLIGPATYNLIPGFQLIDKNFILRSDSTGHQPMHNLYTHLLPLVPALLKEKS